MTFTKLQLSDNQDLNVYSHGYIHEKRVKFSAFLDFVQMSSYIEFLLNEMKNVTETGSLSDHSNETI